MVDEIKFEEDELDDLPLAQRFKTRKAKSEESQPPPPDTEILITTPASSTNLSKINPAINSAILLCVLVLLTGYYNMGALPDASEMDQELYREPIQRAVNERNYRFEWKGSTYIIEPVADYDIAGVVVTHNNVSGIGDAYNTSNSVALKDLCVLWGDNISSNNFHKMEFWSDPWTCWMSTPDRAVFSEFNQNQLANNHLLAADETVAKKIQSVRIGDQVRLTGQLVNYRMVGGDWEKRNTSTVRTDRGNGACETMMVHDIEILARGTPGWYWVWDIAKVGLILLVLAKLLSFVALPLRYYRRFAG